jgi:hypothetical protein
MEEAESGPRDPFANTTRFWARLPRFPGMDMRELLFTETTIGPNHDVATILAVTTPSSPVPGEEEGKSYGYVDVELAVANDSFTGRLITMQSTPLVVSLGKSELA